LSGCTHTFASVRLAPDWHFACSVISRRKESQVKLWTSLALMGSALFFEGCGGTHVGMYATSAPPPIRIESRGYAPGPGYYWVPGNYLYNSGGYVWRPGRWDRPPAGRHRWDNGRWDRRGNRYYYREGRWR
jgi:hypothetical protein